MKRQSIIVVMICILCIIATFAYADIIALNTNLYNTYGQFNSSLYNWNFQNNAWLTNNLLLPRTSMSNIFNYTSMAFNPVFQSPMSFSHIYSNPNSRINYGYNYQYNMPGFTTNYWAGGTPWTSSFTNPLVGNYMGNWWSGTVPAFSTFWGPTTTYPVSNIFKYTGSLFSGGSGSSSGSTSSGSSTGSSAQSVNPSYQSSSPSYSSYSSYAPSPGISYFSAVTPSASYYPSSVAMGGTMGAYGGYAGSYTPSSYIGYSTGGAMDINNFRRNIDNDFLPIPTDVTYEGLFYDYYFDTGQDTACDQLFCPSYRLAVTVDPFSEYKEYFMSVGLNSGIKKEDFQRKKLNLVIVLDISGSMGATFSTYYYDRFGNSYEVEEEADLDRAKIEIAKEALVALIDHLNGEDRFGLVLFEASASVHYPLELIGETNVQQLKDGIMEITANGSTNLASGIQLATTMFAPYLTIDHTEYENRIIFLTDLMPNTGETSSSGLLGMAKSNADDMVYSTFIGIGVDFNTELVEFITKIRGCNYYSVFSPTQFREQMDEEFEFMVTPLVFNLELIFTSTGFEIEKVYGSPEADEATGELMKINTLFPSETTEEGTKGGIVILKLSRFDPNDTGGSDDSQITLSVDYEDRLGNSHSTSETITFGDIEPEYFDNNGIRKAILLTRYANLLKNWIIDERKSLKDNMPVESSMEAENGNACIPIYTSVYPYTMYRCYPPTSPIPLAASIDLGDWERQSTDLIVSDPYKQLFTEFKTYFETEMTSIGDDTLSQEVDVLEKLSTYGD